MKIRITVFILLFSITKLFAQSDSTQKGSYFNKLNYNASYYGETVWYPGIKIGAEYILLEKKKERIIKRNKKGDYTKVKTNQLIITGNLGYYWQPHNYGAVFINSALLYRHTANKGFQYNFGLSPLGMNTLFFNETYKVSDDGEVEKAFLPSRFFYAPSIIMGIGHRMKKKRLSAWFINIHLTSLMPYNNAVNFLAALELGFRFNGKK